MKDLLKDQNPLGSIYLFVMLNQNIFGLFY